MMTYDEFPMLDTANTIALYKFLLKTCRQVVKRTWLLHGYNFYEISFLGQLYHEMTQVLHFFEQKKGLYNQTVQINRLDDDKSVKVTIRCKLRTGPANFAYHITHEGWINKVAV